MQVTDLNQSSIKETKIGVNKSYRNAESDHKQTSLNGQSMTVPNNTQTMPGSSQTELLN
jgi:hypothetical protein